MQLIWVVAGGALGSGLRHTLSGALSHEGEAFPQGTFAVNLIGSFLLAVLFELAPEQGSLRLFLGAGVMGGFTTYSSFNLETMKLLTGGNAATGLLYMVATLVGCLVAACIGVGCVRWLR